MESSMTDRRVNGTSTAPPPENLPSSLTTALVPVIRITRPEQAAPKMSNCTRDPFLMVSFVGTLSSANCAVEIFKG